MDNNSRVGVYVGTYGKYNEGYLDGKWMYPADYDTREDFIDACYELHNDESHDSIELMFQDIENLPKEIYSESYFSDEDFDFAKYVDDNPDALGSAYAYVENFMKWDESDYEDRYQGEYDSLEDFAENFINECGGIKEAVGHPEDYFDYEHFGRELKWDLNEDDEWEAELLDLSDYDCGERYIDEVYGGISNAHEDLISSYFDYEQFGRDLNFSGDVDFVDGYVFWAN